jgi:hypothetical protein
LRKWTEKEKYIASPWTNFGAHFKQLCSERTAWLRITLVTVAQS